MTSYGGASGSRSRERGTRPIVTWETDSTEVKPGLYRYRYLLVLADIFSEWTEAHPTKHETSLLVAKKLLEDIILMYGLSVLLRSDNGPAFLPRVTQKLVKAVGTNWKLHCAYHCQSLGKVEGMNRSLEETLTKLALGTGGDWVSLLTFALSWVWNSPCTLGLTPPEIMCPRPPALLCHAKAEALLNLIIKGFFPAYKPNSRHRSISGSN